MSLATRQGGITKTGNAHLRRIVVESAWCYRHRPCVGAKLRKRQQGVSAQITEIAWKAQNRLHKRYRKPTMAGKDHRKIMTAIARELLGFIWAISIKASKPAHHNWQCDEKRKSNKNLPRKEKQKP